MTFLVIGFMVLAVGYVYLWTNLQRLTDESRINANNNIEKFNLVNNWMDKTDGRLNVIELTEAVDQENESSS